MDRVAIEFHKNVYLLTQFVPSNDEFKKHFKEGMFDKPNTLGFIHVSFYLLNVYYKDNVRSKIQWPVICKQTENKFRNDVRECLMSMANENPDINFPPIFASHLLLARGTKFLLIMWKFSLVVLRTYLQREYQSVITITPKPGPCQELTKVFLKNFVQDHQNSIKSIRKERENTEEEVTNFKRKKSEEQNKLKAKILKMKEDLKDIISVAPVNETAKKMLMDVENKEIVSMWTNFMDNDIKSKIKASHATISEVNELLKTIGTIVSIVSGDSQALNALNFDRINVEPIYKLVPPELQVLPYNLYNKENLNLQNLFCIFNILIQKYKSDFQKDQLDEFSKCNIQLQTSNRDLKTAAERLQNLHEEIVKFDTQEIKKCDELSDTIRITSNALEIDKVLLMPSPSIQINSCTEGRKSIYQNHLQLTPVEGAHKQLFSRHAFKTEKMLTAKKKLLAVQRINFDDTTVCDTSTDKPFASQQRFHTPSKLRSTFKNVDKYSRIFSSCKLNDNRVNSSVMMMLSNNGNSMLPLMSKQHCISLMDSCNSSQDFSQEPLLLNPKLNSTIEPSKRDIEKAPQKTNKRRSIGDLVDRYRKLLHKRDTSSQESNLSARETLGEERVIQVD